MPDEFDLLCEGCGYSLVGLMSDRCPECGEAFDPTLLPLARVPWLYRRRLGKVRSFIQTCWAILVRPTAFAREMCRPIRISMQDARLFRTWCIRIVIGTGLITLAAALAINVPWSEIVQNVTLARWKELTAAVVAFVLAVVLLNVALRLATDLPTFIWKGLAANPHDLAPLHYYAAAPLCLVPLVVIPGGVLLQYAENLGSQNRHDLTAIIVIAMTAGGAIIAALSWWIPLRLMKQATACTTARVIGLAAYLPAHWFLIGGMCGMAFALAMYVLNVVMYGSPF